MDLKQFFSQHKRTMSMAGGISAIVFVLALLGGALAVEAYFDDRVYPGVGYKGIDLGGLTRSEARTVLETWQDQWWQKELKYTAHDESGKVLTTTSFFPVLVAEGSSQSFELVWYDVEEMLERAFQVGRVEHGRTSNRLKRSVTLVRNVFSPVLLTPTVEVDEPRLEETLRAKLDDYETAAHDASFVWRSPVLRPTIVTEETGNTFDYAAAIRDTKTMLYDMRFLAVPVHRSVRTPQVTTADAQAALEMLPELQNKFPLSVTYRDQVFGVDRVYELTWAQAYQAVQLVPANAEKPVRLALMAEQLNPFFALIESEVDVEPQNAKFEIAEDSKVEQFEPSRTGYAVQREETTDALNRALAASGKTVALSVQTLQPEISTGTVNGLGIKEVLGVGYSNFRGSPANRVHNIRVGVEKLHGTLISPGEEFSLLKALRPFTTAAGYRPELVIKGDKIEPEIGGGLCQIGSTTFRAAMNSGLHISERRNHSLVVSYYNDHRNHNPGTDATIYDPAPDLKFVNDTGNYILIMTDMNTATGDLNFTFWGTSDGRRAEYSEPVVKRWIPAGEEKLIESPDLKPGEKKCQEAHVGAVTTFDYTINRPGEDAQVVTFDSTYRPLPRICLVGISTETPVDPSVPEGDQEAATTPEGEPILF